MPLPKEITVAVLTYKRKNKLSVCLTSFLNQKDKFKILLIDNDFEKSAFKIFLKFKKKLDVQYLVEPSKNISKARNLAIKNCQSQYLAFVDDDCILSKNWSNFASLVIKKGNNLAFIQGNSISKNLNKAQMVAQNNIYQNWIKNNLKNNFIDPQALDTKNIILNLKLIKRYKIIFDANLPIFEDVDFGLQLKKCRLKGILEPGMLVEHEELMGFTKIIKKFYFRGKIKYILNKKWKDFDGFNPRFFDEIGRIIEEPQKIYEHLFNQFFNTGFLMAKFQKFNFNKNKIIILNYLDKGANEERAVCLMNFLKKNDFEAEIIDSQILFNKNFKKITNLFSNPWAYLIYRFFKLLKLRLRTDPSYIFYLETVLRGNILKKYFLEKNVGAIIIQYPEDILLAKEYRKNKIILDLPTIYSEETKNSKIAKLEKKIFKQKNNICFHWYSFLNLSKKLKMAPKNSFILNWGCNQREVLAKYNEKAKIIYLGKLNSEWIYPKLLEKIQKKSPYLLDIYSYESPDKNLYKSIKIKGFMKNIDDVSKYQFGLLSFVDDRLRDNGFSAKHLLYLSYGLPVLCPEWRKDKLLKPATIYYNAENFNQQIKKYSQKKYWNQKHLAAIKLAKKFDWNQTLKPILPIIYKIQNEI